MPFSAFDKLSTLGTDILLPAPVTFPEGVLVLQAIPDTANLTHLGFYNRAGIIGAVKPERCQMIAKLSSLGGLFQLIPHIILEDGSDVRLSGTAPMNIATPAADCLVVIVMQKPAVGATVTPGTLSMSVYHQPSGTFVAYSYWNFEGLDVKDFYFMIENPTAVAGADFTVQSVEARFIK